MQIFKTAPEGADITNSRVLGGATASPRPLSHVYPRMPGGDAPARPLYPTDHNSYSTEGSSASFRSRLRPAGGYYSQISIGQFNMIELDCHLVEHSSSVTTARELGFKPCALASDLGQVRSPYIAAVYSNNPSRQMITW